MSREVERAMRSLGWKTESDRWWESFERLWSIVGVTEGVKQNLLVLAMSDKLEVRIAAAHEVASAIGAAAFAGIAAVQL